MKKKIIHGVMKLLTNNSIFLGNPKFSPPNGMATGDQEQINKV